MTQEVLPLRFVNTPTVGEIYGETTKTEELDIDEEKEEKLSDEYDKVDGTEAYYRVLFDHLAKRRKMGDVTGNEGLFEWAKKAVQGVIETIKAFFSWVWSLFGGKSKQIESKASDLAARVARTGVKKGDLTYPASYVKLWASPSKPPTTLGWMHDKIAKVTKAIEQCADYSKSVHDYTEKVHSTYSPKIASFGHFQGEMDKVIAQHGTAVAAIFKNDVSNWIGGARVTVNKEGKVNITRIPGGIKSVKDAKFQTNLTEVQKVVEEITAANKKFGELIVKNIALEKDAIKVMESSLDMLKVFSSNNTGKAKEVMALMKKVTNNAMFAIKSHDILFTEVLLSATYIVNAALVSGGKKE